MNNRDLNIDQNNRDYDFLRHRAALLPYIDVPLLSPCAALSLSELETDIRVFKDSMLKILDEDEIIEELCLTKWTDPRVLYVALSPVHARTHALTHTNTHTRQY